MSFWLDIGSAVWVVVYMHSYAGTSTILCTIVQFSNCNYWISTVKSIYSLTSFCVCSIALLPKTCSPKLFTWKSSANSYCLYKISIKLSVPVPIISASLPNITSIICERKCYIVHNVLQKLIYLAYHYDSIICLIIIFFRLNSQVTSFSHFSFNAIIKS